MTKLNKSNFARFDDKLCAELKAYCIHGNLNEHDSIDLAIATGRILGNIKAALTADQQKEYAFDDLRILTKGQPKPALIEKLMKTAFDIALGEPGKGQHKR